MLLQEPTVALLVCTLYGVPLYRHWDSAQAVWPIGGLEVQLYSFMTTALEGGEGSASRPRPLFTPRKATEPIAQKAGWPPGWVWTGSENLAPTGIRSPDRPARSQSLYRLHYPAHIHYIEGSKSRQGEEPAKYIVKWTFRGRNCESCRNVGIFLHKNINVVG